MEKSEEENLEGCVRGSLKKGGTLGARNDGKKKKKVKWVDSSGDQLAVIREFESR